MGHLLKLKHTFKRTVLRDFLLLVFFMNQFPSSPRVSHKDRFEFFRKFVAIFGKSRCTTVINDIDGHFAAGINDTSGKFATGVNAKFNIL
jgi:hypothetical protein